MAVEISDVAELQAMTSDLAGDYLLVNDIDASATSGWNSGAGFEPVGTSASRFTGSFNGGGFSISDLFIDRSGTPNVGLFGWFDTAVNPLTDFSLVDCDITGGNNAAAVAGFFRATASNISVSGAIAGGSNTGGLVGEAIDATISDITIDATVSGTTNVGGLIGGTVSAITTAIRVAISGSVTGTGDTGGACGAASLLEIRQSKSSASVSGGTWTGGFIGRGGVTTASDSVREDCYCTGSSSRAGFIGIDRGTTRRCYSTGTASSGNGFSGLNDGTTTDCFWDTQSSGVATSAGGTGKTTAQMKDVATYTDTATAGLTNPWDFVGDPNDDVATDDIWDIDSGVNDGYPYLTWEDVEPPPSQSILPILMQLGL